MYIVILPGDILVCEIYLLKRLFYIKAKNLSDTVLY